MANHSKIEWTDATWDPVRGCTKVSPGCAHCYAQTFAERFRHRQAVGRRAEVRNGPRTGRPHAR
jgi:protein gp37